MHEAGPGKSPAIDVLPAGGRQSCRRVRWLAAVLRTFYFRRVSIAGARPPPDVARLVLASHRNGAIDGYLVLKAFPRAVAMVSIQLLRKPLVRWLFDGLVVVRRKDLARYGAWRGAFADPVAAGCAQLRAGGDLLVFPEGSSEWGFRPLPYQRGAARIARALCDEGVGFTVVPLGLHYPAPDHFRSCVELVPGAPVAVPGRKPDEAVRAWELRIHQAFSAALDAVSVNCPDADAFAAASAYASAVARAGGSYAHAFIDAQQRLADHRPLPAVAAAPARRAWPWDWLAVAAFMVLFAPVLLAGWFAGTRADARNTVSFFRILGGLPVALAWLPCLWIATWCWPLPMLGGWLLAALGWWRWPCVMHRNAP